MVSCSRIRQDGQTRTPLTVCCPPPRRPPRSHRCRHRGHRTRGHRRRTPDAQDPDIGQPTRGHRIRGQCTGHRTRGRGRVRRQSDLGTADIRTTSWTPRPPACPLDAEPWTCGRRLRRSATMTGSATVRYLPARDYPPHYQAPARSLRRPSRALAHCSPRNEFRVERRANGEPSSVMAGPCVPIRRQTQYICGGHGGSSLGVWGLSPVGGCGGCSAAVASAHE
jgi:hypothetical protein